VTDWGGVDPRLAALMAVAYVIICLFGPTA
jgi:hypothetical protein